MQPADNRERVYMSQREAPNRRTSERLKDRHGDVAMSHPVDDGTQVPTSRETVHNYEQGWAVLSTPGFNATAVEFTMRTSLKRAAACHYKNNTL